MLARWKRNLADSLLVSGRIAWTLASVVH
jgi:hypothetical protein